LVILHVAQRSASAANLQHPELIGGRYRVERALGSGGMARVWQVHDIAKDRALALKRLSREQHSALFEREYYALTGLHHPNIVEVYDYGSDAAGPYYTMQLLHGSDVSALAPRPWPEVCRILRDVASALALVHARRYLHRDISARNVWLTSDGRIKLIDFGTLVPFGRNTDVAGTPPFVAPEALNGAELDQRTDLYALGALGYWLLTGLHAFAARTLTELSDLWPERPPAASLRVAELKRADLPPVPAALDLLLDALLAVDAGMRPSSAASVIDSLCAIAGLQPESQALVQRSYLRTPALVGRSREMQLLQEALHRTRRGRGGGVVIEAAPGFGRTRLLHELALRARLASSVVLQAESDAQGVAEQLSHRLLDALPQIAAEAAQPFASTLAHLSPELRTRLDVAERDLAELPNTHGEARMRVQAALCDWFAKVAEQHSLLLLVDDFDACDASTASFLTALVRAARTRRLLIVVSARNDLERSGGVDGFVRHATLLGLSALTARDIERMLDSIFGEAQHLGRLSDVVSQRCDGKPRDALDLLEHLLQQGSIHYADGAWLLPLSIPEEQLPLDAEHVIAARIARLPQHAQELGQMLSVCEGVIGFELCAALSETSPAHTYEALEVLVSEGVLLGSRVGYRFAREALRAGLGQQLSAARRQRAHRTSGELLLRVHALTPLERLRAGLHLLQGGEVERGTEQIAGAALHYGLVDLADVGQAAPALERALKLCLALGRPKHELLTLYAPLALAGYYAERHYADRYTETTLALLQELLGLSLARSLRKRLGRKLSLATGLGWAALQFQVRHDNPRVPSFRQAVMLLFYCVAASTGVCAVCVDAKRARRYAEILEPMRALGRDHVATLMHDFCLNLAITVQDKPAEACERWQAMISRLDSGQPVRDLPEEVRVLYLAGALYACGAMETFRDTGKALQYAERLEAFKLKLYELSAHQIRMLYYANQGNLELAEYHRERVETHAIQRGTAWQAETWTYGAMIGVYTRTHNASGLKHCAQQLARLSREVTSLQRLSHRAQGGYLMQRGSLVEAHGVLDNDEPPLQSAGWGRGRGTFAGVLNLLGDHAKAREVCQHALAQLSHGDLKFPGLYLGLQIELALAQAGLGDLHGAAERLDALIREHTSHGGPLTLGELHEARVRVAAGMRDRAALEHHIERLLLWRSQCGEAALMARAQHLAKSSRNAIAGIVPTVRPSGGESVAPQARTVIHRLRHGGARTLAASAEWIMDQLGEYADIRAGHVFLWSNGELWCVASRGEIPDPAEFERFVRERLSDEHDDATTQQVDLIDTHGDHDLISVRNGSYRLLRLFASNTRGTPLGALLLSEQTLFQIPKQVLQAIADRLQQTAAASS
jgi:tRNA A-37 threonylcarbamoyl transferase component Bud32